MKNKFFICLFILLANSACNLYQDPKVPVLEEPVQFQAAISMPEGILPAKEWWTIFNDETLDHLIKLALKNNYDYAIAIKNIRIAQTYVTQNASALYPQINLNFASSRNKSATAITNSFGNTNNVTLSNPQSQSFSQIFNLNQLFGSVSYEIDVWNQIRNSVKQAKAQVKVSEAQSNIIRLTVINNVALSYFQLKVLEANIDNLLSQKHYAKELVTLLTVQFRSGLIDATRVDDAKSALDTLDINLAQARQQKAIISYTLAVLLGEYPEDFTITVKGDLAAQMGKSLIPAGIPAIVVAQRPDIQSAYYQVMASGYFEKQTIANFLPTFNLTSAYGFASNSLSKLIRSGNNYWNYGENNLENLFDGGLRISEKQRASLQVQTAILTYKNTAITAFKEIDSALTAYQEDVQALHAYQHQVANSSDKFFIAKAQYQGGLTDYATFSDTALVYLQTQYNLSQQQGIVIADVLQVYKTLGIGSV